MVGDGEGDLPPQAYSAAQVERMLDRLLVTGTLDQTQAAAIRTELIAAGPLSAGEHRPGEPRPGEHSRADHLATGVIAASYVGVALIAAAVGTLILTNWSDLSTTARIVVFAALAAVLVAVGALLRGRLDPARGLVWLVAVPAAGGLGAAIAGATDADYDTRFVAAAGAATVLAFALLVVRRGAAQVVAVVSALVVTAAAIGARVDLSDEGTGWLLVGLGAVLMVVAVAGRLPLPQLVIGLAGMVALVGIHLIATDALGRAVLLAVVLTVAGYAEAMRGDSAVPLIVATLTVATVTPRALGEWLDDSVGVSGILALSGLVVLGAAAVHLRMTRRYNRGSTSRS